MSRPTLRSCCSFAGGRLQGRLCVRSLIQARLGPPLLSYKVVLALPVVAVLDYGNDREGGDYLVTQQGGGADPGLDEPADAEPAMVLLLTGFLANTAALPHAACTQTECSSGPAQAQQLSWPEAQLLQQQQATHRVHGLLWVLAQLLDCQRHIDHLSTAQPHTQRVKQVCVTQGVFALVLQAYDSSRRGTSQCQAAHMSGMAARHVLGGGKPWSAAAAGSGLCVDALQNIQGACCCHSKVCACRRSGPPSHLVWCLHVHRLSCLWVDGHISVPAVRASSGCSAHTKRLAAAVCA